MTEGGRKKFYHSGIPLYYYFGGCLVLFYILTATWVAPRFGQTNAIAFVLLRQLLAMSLIDHFGWIFGRMGAQQFSLSAQRLKGPRLMVAGVFQILN